MKLLKDNGRIRFNKGGDGFDFRVRSSESAIGGSTTDWGERDAATTNTFIKVSDDYRQYTWRLVFSKFQEQRNRNAGPEAKMFEMAAEQLNEVKQSATDRINAHMYNNTTLTGDNGTNINGLEQIIDDNNTYLSIDRTVGANAFWKAQVRTVASANFTSDTDSDGTKDGEEALNLLWTDCSKGLQSGQGISPTSAVTKDTPNCLITDSTGFNLYMRLFRGEYRFTDRSADPEKVLTFHGIPVKWDAFSSASRFWLINTRHLQIDVVGPQILEMLVEEDKGSPVAKIITLGGQLAMYSKNPRYLGVLQLT